MSAHLYFLQGVNQSNINDVSSKLSEIDGAKPIQTEQTNKVSVFLAINHLSHEEVTAKILSVTSGTGIVVFQTNMV